MTTLIIILVIAFLIFLFWQGSWNKYFHEGYNDGNTGASEKKKVDISFEDSLSKEGKYLVLDIETTGFPKGNINDLENLGNWPRIVQFAWLLLDKDYMLILSESHIIRQERPIPTDAIRVHGITDARARKEGKEITVVLEEFQKALSNAQIIIAHNIDFDIPIIDSEFLRAGQDKQFSQKTLICTMKSSIEFCRLGSGGRYKYPKLAELYQKCFYPDSRGKMTILAAHDALNDAALTAKCFTRLKELSVINDTETGVSYDKRTNDEKEKENQFYLQNKREELLKPYKPKADYTLEFNALIRLASLRKGDVLQLIFAEKEIYLENPTYLVIKLAGPNHQVIGELKDKTCIKPIKAHFNDYNLEATFLGFYNERYIVSVHPVHIPNPVPGKTDL